PEEATKWVRERPHLRLIDDALFFKAQALLDESEAKWVAVRTNNGQLHGSKPDAYPSRHLLQWLIKCARCGGTFQVGGANGKYLACSGYRRGLCQVKTRLARQLAERQLLSAIGERVFAQPEWLDAVVKETHRAWEHRLRQEPTELANVDRKLAEVNQMI